MKSSALRRSLYALAHPLSLGALLLLLLNDHLLRVRWPSWWTGKVGDAAWLVFAPFVVALPLACLWPRRERRVGMASVGLTGALFALVKGVPPAHAAFVAAFRLLLGWRPSLLCDPTDLLTLPALGLAWWIWKRDLPARAPAPRWAGVALSLASLLTVANSVPYDPGINCLMVSEGRVFAFPHDGSSSSTSYYTYHSDFVSDDGGFTWNKFATVDLSEIPDCPGEYPDPWILVDPSSEVCFRFTPGKRIESSSDGGLTWIPEVRCSKRYVRPAHELHTGYMGKPPKPGPWDAVIDPETGNLIVAMEWKGVLVRTPDGEWEWITLAASDRDVYEVEIRNEGWRVE